MSRQDARILLVEDDARFAARLQRNLSLDGFEVETASNGAQGLARLTQATYDLVLTDIKMPDMDGMQLLAHIRGGEQPGVDPDVPVVMLTSINTMQVAVDAFRQGASDFLTKEQERDEIVHRLRALLERESVRRENQLLKTRLAEQSEHGDVVLASESMRRVLEQARTVAPTPANVLILGETGVGKDLVAHHIHQAGDRVDKPFCEVNCAALPDDNMFQSELFGHERGAFTGADRQKRGRFELAGGGTLFLDEIGDLSPESQGKLLRAIETRRIERLGGVKTLAIDVRVILATNHDLAKDVAAGRFRQDLYYRINGVQLVIPPLRERPEDIAPLMEHFLDRYAQRYRKPPRNLETDARGVLERHTWPGNVRELRNLCERLVLLGRGEAVTAAELRTGGLGEAMPPPDVPELVTLPPHGAPLEEIERQAILQALQQAQWVQREAARLLDISADRMNARVKKFGITHPSWRG